MSLTVTQRVEFECGYLIELNGQKQVQSHRYNLEVTVSGNQRFEDNGYVIEFETLKKILKSCVPNSKFIFTKNQDYTLPGERNIADIFDLFGYLSEQVDFRPTCENLLVWITDKIQDILDIREPGVRIENAKLRESPTSYAERKMN